MLKLRRPVQAFGVGGRRLILHLPTAFHAFALGPLRVRQIQLNKYLVLCRRGRFEHEAAASRVEGRVELSARDGIS